MRVDGQKVEVGAVMVVITGTAVGFMAGVLSLAHTIDIVRNKNFISMYAGEKKIAAVGGYVDVRGDKRCVVIDGVDRACWNPKDFN